MAIQVVYKGCTKGKNLQNYTNLYKLHPIIHTTWNFLCAPKENKQPSVCTKIYFSLQTTRINASGPTLSR